MDGCESKITIQLLYEEIIKINSTIERLEHRIEITIREVGNLKAIVNKLKAQRDSIAKSTRRDERIDMV